MQKQNNKIKIAFVSLAAFAVLTVFPVRTFAVGTLDEFCACVNDPNGEGEVGCNQNLATSYTEANCSTSSTGSGSVTGPTQCQLEGLTNKQQCCAVHPQDGICTGAVTPSTGSGSGTVTPPSGGTPNPNGGAVTPPTGGTPTSNLCDPANFTYENGLCLPKSQVRGGIADSKSLTELIAKVLKLLLGLAGAIAVVLVVFGGFQYLTSAGNEETAEKGKKTLMNAAIGLAIIILGYTIVTLVVNTLTK